MSYIKDLLTQTPKVLSNLDIEVFDGTSWVSLNDRLHFRLGARTLSETTQTRSNLSATSTLFDGEWVFHSNRANVTETVEVYVYGESWAQIAMTADALIEAFSQQLYEVRLHIDDYRETWRCFPADYAMNRSHTYLHGFQMGLNFSVPHLPDPVKEVLV